MDEIGYKGFVIRPAPWQLADNGEWMVRVTIERHRGSEIREQTFTAANSFEDREAAVDHSFNFGRQIIDGEYEGFSVAQL